ncbi:MAG: DUF4412 domain-containing protein [Candidatus Rokuibacteriota bacterium]
MFPHRVLGGSLLAGILVWSGQAAAGWVIEQMQKGGAEGGQQQVTLQANRLKTLTVEPDGKPGMAFIVDLDAQTITQVLYPERSYATATVQEYGQMMRGVMTDAMKQMQEALKDMPPQQRKMAEEMMRSQMGQGGQKAQECREPRIELRKTGQQATIAGYPAVRYDVLADGKLDSELWIAKGITAWRELDPRKLERLGAEMAELAACGSTQRGQGFLGADSASKLAHEGYPVRMVDRSGGGGTVEVVKAESRTVPAAEFQPPAGFARKTFREMMGQ